MLGYCAWTYVKLSGITWNTRPISITACRAVENAILALNARTPSRSNSLFSEKRDETLMQTPSLSASGVAAGCFLAALFGLAIGARGL
jgi:hypothetical protein